MDVPSYPYVVVIFVGTKPGAMEVISNEEDERRLGTSLAKIVQNIPVGTTVAIFKQVFNYTKGESTNV